MSLIELRCVCGRSVIVDPKLVRMRKPPSAPAADPEAFVAASDKPRQGAIVQAWRPLGELGDVFGTKPPKRRWLLKRDGDGVLPLGKVGIFAAAGGVGKTMACVQLALAVATGRRWLAGAGAQGAGGFEVPSEGAGHVLLALGEEAAEEVPRRVYNAALAMGLTPDERKLALERIVVLPLAGQHVSLTHAADAMGESPETHAATALREKMQSTGIEWRLVVLDPLSRFAGPDAEKDNAAATRFIETAETFCKLRGEPTVLVVHHSAQHARGDGNARPQGRDASQVARGATGITDGARWVASLDSLRSDAEGLEHLAELVVVKNNYAKPMHEPVTLRRNREYSGALHELDAKDLAAVIEARKAKAAAKAGNGTTTRTPAGRPDLA
jgi:RecA-family ATPase